jgi:hypothetical protein
MSEQTKAAGGTKAKAKAGDGAKKTCPVTRKQFWGDKAPPSLVVDFKLNGEVLTTKVAGR